MSEQQIAEKSGQLGAERLIINNKLQRTEKLKINS